MATDSFSELELTDLATEILNDPNFDQLLCETGSNSSTRSYSSINIYDGELSNSNNNNSIIRKHTISQSTSLCSVSKAIHLSSTNINIDLSSCITPTVTTKRKSKTPTPKRKSKKLKKHKRKSKSKSKNKLKSDSNTNIDLQNFVNNQINKLKDLIREIFSSDYDIAETARNSLILCHLSFIKSCDLFIEFRRIFCMNISEMTYTIFKFEDNIFNEDKIYFIQLKITQCIIYWIKQYWLNDFINNKQLQKQIELFKFDIKRITNIIKSNQLMDLLLNALQFIETKYNNKKLNINIHISIENRYPDLTKLDMCNTSNFELMEFNPIDIAQQLTLLDSQIFRSINERECIEQKWKSKNKIFDAPNILNIIAQFNDINKWVQITILKAETIKNRKTILKKMITMATYFMENGNLSSLCAFYYALTSKNISSLYKTWKLLSNKKLKEFDNIKKLFGWKLNKFKLINQKLESPSVPHMGCILEKLFQIEEMSKTQNKNKNNKLINSIDGKIDSNKIISLYKQINNIKNLQKKRYEYVPDLLIQKLLVTELQLNDQLNEKVLNKLAKSLANSENKFN